MDINPSDPTRYLGEVITATDPFEVAVKHLVAAGLNEDAAKMLISNARGRGEALIPRAEYLVEQIAAYKRLPGASA